MTIALIKLAKLKAGERVITNDKELDEMLSSGDDAAYSIRTIPNPDRVGVLDVWEAWIQRSIS